MHIYSFLICHVSVHATGAAKAVEEAVSTSPFFKHLHEPQRDQQLTATSGICLLMVDSQFLEKTGCLKTTFEIEGKEVQRVVRFGRKLLT
jgi:hypothetical protein